MYKHAVCDFSLTAQVRWDFKVLTELKEDRGFTPPVALDPLIIDQEKIDSTIKTQLRQEFLVEVMVPVRPFLDIDMCKHNTGGKHQTSRFKGLVGPHHTPLGRV